MSAVQITTPEPEDPGKWRFPEIPRSWIIVFLLFTLVLMRFYGIDSWTTAALGVLIGYVTGKHVSETTDIKYLE